MLSEPQRLESRQRISDAVAADEASTVLAEVRRLIEGSSKRSADTSFSASALGRIGETLVSKTGLRRLKTYVVRSVTLEPLVPALKVEAALQGFVLDLKLGDYGSYLNDPIDEAGPLAQFSPDLVLVVLELEDVAGDLAELIAAGNGSAAFERIDAATELLGQLLRGLRRFSKARVVLQGFVIPDRSPAGDVGDANFAWSLPRAVAELNARLGALCREVPDCVFFDVDRVAGRFGRSVWQDARLFLATRLPVASAAQPAYVRGLMRSAAALYRAPRKVLCTDLDNTFWGGILGEDGPGGIATGSAFPGNCYLAYQRYLKQLSARGILLAVVSKNNPGDVEEAFAQRASDLALRLDDFVARKIGWADKTAALKELAAELSLGLDSFVFVDDHPVECEAMRQQLPQVATVQVPANEPWRFVEMLAAEPFFDTPTLTEADSQRRDEYRAQARRAELAESAGSREDFLRSLDIVCTFITAAEAPLARAVQLLGKTNQFNLTTRRHGAAEVEHFAAKGQAVAVRVRDRFGDAGVVGLALIDVKDGGAVWHIDSFLLSCRVIGRGIESALLCELICRARLAGARRLTGEYIPTSKNALCANFYPEQGFVPDPGGGVFVEGAVRYALDLTSAEYQSPSWVKLEYTSEEIQDRESVCANVAS